GMLAEGSVFDQVFTRDAVRFIQQEHLQPFYMTLSLINPHDICKVLGGKVAGATIADAIFFCRTDDELYLRFSERPKLPDTHAVEPLAGMYRSKDYMYEELKNWSEDEWQRYLAAYCLLIEKTDWYIEHVLNALRDAGLEDNTIVMFTTDHGEMVGSHGLISKTIFYEASAKTMMLIRHPQRITATSVDTQSLISTQDIMPTLLDMCNVEIPKGLDGHSFKSCCYGEQADDFSRLVSVNHDGRMVRYQHYKYIHSYIDGEHHHILFDLEADPQESYNVYAQMGYEEISEQLRSWLDNWLVEQDLTVVFDPVGS
ncbi:MAG: sulfatase-like hydrolase/transferase, partial [Chloroflexota bacterium]